MAANKQGRSSARPTTPDATDMVILVALEAHARTPAAELGRRAGHSEATVRQRMDALCSSQVIRSYRADVDLDRLLPTVEAFVQATSDLRNLARIRSALTALSCVVAADVVSGDREVMIHLVARSVRELATILSRDIAPLGLEDVDVRLVLRPLVQARVPDLMGLVGSRPALPVLFPETAEPAEPLALPPVPPAP